MRRPPTWLPLHMARRRRTGDTDSILGAIAMLAFMGVGQTELIILGGMCFLLLIVGAIALVAILIAKSGTSIGSGRQTDGREWDSLRDPRSAWGSAGTPVARARLEVSFHAQAYRGSMFLK
jgi:hypothetical protein